MKVYHLLARLKYGPMVQILSGLITYMLLAIYCHEEFGERVNIRRLRQISLEIQRDMIGLKPSHCRKRQGRFRPYLSARS